MSNDVFIKILLSIIGSVCIFGVKQLTSIAKSMHEIKSALEVLNVKHSYLEGRVKDIEKKNV